MYYYIDTKVTTWVREWFEAESDEEAKKLVKTGNYTNNKFSSEVSLDDTWYHDTYELYRMSGEVNILIQRKYGTETP